MSQLFRSIEIRFSVQAEIAGRVKEKKKWKKKEKRKKINEINK